MPKTPRYVLCCHSATNLRGRHPFNTALGEKVRRSPNSYALSVRGVFLKFSGNRNHGYEPCRTMWRLCFVTDVILTPPCTMGMVVTGTIACIRARTFNNIGDNTSSSLDFSSPLASDFRRLDEWLIYSHFVVNIYSMVLCGKQLFDGTQIHTKFILLRFWHIPKVISVIIRFTPPVYTNSSWKIK